MSLSENLGAAWTNARARTDELFELVRPEALYDRPIPERHRIIFYLGHVEAFDWNLIQGHGAGLTSFQPEFDHLFAFGIDPPPGQLPADQPHHWPSVDQVRQYCARVRAALDAVFDTLPEQLVHVAVEHRLMHAETLAYILHNLDYDRKLAPPSSTPSLGSDRIPPTQMIAIAARKIQVGMPEGQGFGWDNEFHARCVEVPAFAISRYKVTNGEYLEFVRQGAPAPFYWRERAGQYFYRGMFAEVPLPLDCPVYVTHQEASTYASWRGLRLPTEAEHQRAAADTGVSSNVDFRYWDPIPVTEGEAAGVATPHQMVGNGWEWTSSLFAPFEGFQPMPFYANYSEPFFDGAHYVMKGGSPRTAACMLRPSFRNWFRPAYPYVYATMRLVES